MRNRVRIAVLVLVGTGVSCVTSTAAMASAASEATWRVQVRLRTPSGEHARPSEGSALTAIDLKSERRQRLTLDGEAAESGAADFELETSGAWQLCLEAAELWAPCTPVLDGATEATLTVWPAAWIVGRLQIEGDEGDLSALELSVGPPPGPGPSRALRDTRLTCSWAKRVVSRELPRFRCPAPATELYTAVRLSGFVSRYFWDLEPDPGATVDLGVVRMQPGASLSGWLDVSDPDLTPDKVSAHLVAALSAQTPTATAVKVETAGLNSRLGPHGFFQFRDVEPGVYMLEVSHPSFATSRLGPFEVFPGKETELRTPVRLLPPIDLDLFLTPVVAPGERPWRVLVFRARDWSAGSDEVFSGPAGTDGSLRVARQSPGLFQIVVLDDRGNRFHSAQVRLTPGDSGFVPLEIPLVRVVGSLRLGGEPLAARLYFGGRHGALRSTMTSDAEGAFAGFVSREDEWLVEVEAIDPPVETTTRVEIELGPDDVVELNIELPDTRVFGRVVDEEGRPVPDATVRVEAFSELVKQRQQSDAEGEFEFLALPEGAAAVTAHAVVAGQEAVSPPVRVQLQEDLAAGPLDLVLQPMQSIAGRVLAVSGPTPGDRVHAATLGLPMPASDLTATDLEGRFDLQLPAAARLIGLTLLPPGGYLTTAIEPLDGELELRAADRGGELIVWPDAGDGDGELPWVEREGVVVPPAFLLTWVRGHGVQRREGDPLSPFRFPRLAEGHYRVCSIAEVERRDTFRRGGSWQDAVTHATRCAEGELASGGVLELVIEPD